MIDVATLNGFSARFAQRLFERYPEWREHAEMDPGQRDTLRVAVAAPTGAELVVRTYFDQITIDFGRWHTHIGDWSGPDENARFEKALETIDAIVSGKSVVVTRFVFGRHAWSRLIPLEKVRRTVVGRLEVTSWTGARGAPLRGI